ncbi:MAG: hypothetical protein JWQ07_2776 [Ramlibacter sp.]|nr:hypothetical protein [Ramlibacter sp.]
MPPKSSKTSRPNLPKAPALPDPQPAFERAVALHQNGQLAQAGALYEEIVRASPRHVPSLQMLGIVATQQRDFQRAVDLYDRAIALQPELVEAHANRGIALKELKRLPDAIASYDRAIALRPRYATALFNRGNALAEVGQYAAAVESYERAIAIEPGNAEALTNMGNAYTNSLQLDAAIASYDRAIRIQPDYPDGYWNKSCALLLKGELAEGFRLFEWRWKTAKVRMQPRNFAAPLWLGDEPLAGRTILLHAEQGLGDTMQFCRYVPMVAALGGRVLFEVPRALMGLLRTLDCDVEWIEQGTPLPLFDCHCPLMSLPLALKTDLHSVPHPAPYLRTSPEHVRKWAAKLGPRTRPRVGLAWSGSLNYPNDRNRSLALSTLVSHLPGSCDYFSLQNAVRDSDKPTLEMNPQIRHFGSETNDFTDAAALCELMDVVISVDTSFAHLAAALGKPTWVLLPYRPDWRWMIDTAGSPWYSSVRLYRQGQDRDWAGPLKAAAADLARL